MRRTSACASAPKGAVRGAGAGKHGRRRAVPFEGLGALVMVGSAAAMASSLLGGGCS